MISSFSDAIEWDQLWPVNVSKDEEMSIEGHLAWISAYQKAAESISLGNDLHFDTMTFAGPVMQLVGLTTELTLKTVLRGGGEDEKSLRKYSHNTYQAYLSARNHFDEVKFIDLVFSNTQHLEMPDEVRLRLAESGEPNPRLRWRVFFDHLRILDETYDRPYRSRYIKPGHTVLPEPLILLAGTKILQTAMNDMLERARGLMKE
ncbi:MAG: hypothetical protein V3U96_13385 [Paracoccaceae bacterium]